MNFIEQPPAELDTSCVADVVRIDFTNSRVPYNQAGTTDAWE